MRTLKLAAVCTALTLAAIAAEMSGDYNSWLGYLAGMNANGNRSTMQGAGAGGESDEIVRTDFVGAAAGAYATNLTDCVAIGYRALRNASSMSNVVAIGAGALSNRTGMVKATWINGQFYASGQGNTFWIKANPDTPNTNAPIYYADGVLSLNASTIRFNGEATSGGGGGSGGGEPSPILLGYDFYVDPENGDDLYVGTSPGSAKRTIDAAYALVTTNGMRICLLPGVHTSPSYEKSGSEAILKPYRVDYIAPYGPGKTSIDGEGKSFVGSSNAFLSVEGCTLRNFSSNGRNCPALYAVAFSNCVFSGTIHRANYGQLLILSCVFEDCKFNAMLTTDSTSNSMPLRFASEFYKCEAFGSTFVPTYTNTPALFSFSSRFENCYISITEADQFDFSGEDTALGRAPEYVDTTIICTNSAAFGNLRFDGCILGFNSVSNAPSLTQLTNTILTNAATVAAILGDDYRPAVTNWRYRYNGYGSAQERAVRDSMLESIRAALEAAQ